MSSLGITAGLPDLVKCKALPVKTQGMNVQTCSFLKSVDEDSHLGPS